MNITFHTKYITIRRLNLRFSGLMKEYDEVVWMIEDG